MKRVALAIGAGIVATGAVVASAASLGTLNVKTLGTSSSAVTSCATNTINVSWNTDDPVYVGDGTPADSTYTTQTIGVTGPDTCEGATIKVTAADAAGDALSEASGTLNGTGDATLTFDDPFDSKDVVQTTVTIYNENIS